MMKPSIRNSGERGLPSRFGRNHREVDVRLPFPAPVRDKSLELQRPNHARYARVREVGIDTVADFRDGSFAELPEDAHDVQLALGEMNVRHGSVAVVIAA